MSAAPAPAPDAAAPVPDARPPFPTVNRLLNDRALVDHVDAIITEIEIHRPHVEVGKRNLASVTKWTSVCNMYTHPRTGVGRGFKLPQTNRSARFRTLGRKLISGLASNHHAVQNGDPNVQDLAIYRRGYVLFQEMMAAETAHAAAVRRRVEVAQERTERLGAVGAVLGLESPGRGVQPPSLPVALTNNMRQGLEALGQRTVSPRAGSQRGTGFPEARPLVLVDVDAEDARQPPSVAGPPVAADVDVAAAPPAASPVAAAAAAALPAAAPAVAVAAVAPPAAAPAAAAPAATSVTHAVRAPGPAQALAAAGRVGAPTVSPSSVGTRKSTDARDVLARADDYANAGTSELIQLCHSLKPKEPSPVEKQRKELHEELSHQLNLMKQFKDAGLSCDDIKQRVAKLSAKLSENVDKSFGL